MDWEFTKLGIYPMQQRGVFGVFAHPLVHSSFKHLFANTLPFSFFHGACSIFTGKLHPTFYFSSGSVVAY